MEKGLPVKPDRGGMCGGVLACDSGGTLAMNSRQCASENLPVVSASFVSASSRAPAAAVHLTRTLSRSSMVLGVTEVLDHRRSDFWYMS